MSVTPFPKSDRKRTVMEALGDMANELPERVVVLGELSDGSVVFMSSEMTAAHANWILDRSKKMLLEGKR